MTALDTAPNRTRSNQFYELNVTRVDALCHDAAAITFAIPPELATVFAYQPGQSVTVRRTVDGSEQRRTYSICAPPTENAGPASQLRIGVRVVPDGVVSGWLANQVRPGDLIELQPPSGSFTPDTGVAGRHALIAAGSGITPMLAIAAALLRQPAARVTILYGNRRTDSVMFVDELADLKDSYPERLQLVHVLSREAQEVALFNGRLDAAKLRELLPATVAVPEIDHWWLCGPYGLVTDAIEVLTEFGVPRTHIHQELFYVEPAPPTPASHDETPISGLTSEVTVTLDGRSTTTTISRDSPILDGVQRVRPDLPFACRGGVCGTCRAKVTSGAVDMKRNFALEQGEIDAGFVLTCQSRPVSAQLSVDYDA